jgi:hypothetical protein
MRQRLEKNARLHYYASRYYEAHTFLYGWLSGGWKNDIGEELGYLVGGPAFARR